MATTKARAVALDTARGAAIGAVEIIPGVSGGTVALIVGVYERIIDSAGHVVSGVANAVRPTRRHHAKASFAQIEWGLLLPLVVGMLAAVLVAAAVLAPIVESHPVQTRAVFAGLVAASIVVPARMVGKRWGAREYALGVVGAVIAFGITSLPNSETTDPAWFAIMGSAAVAICALVVPGMSGSFILVILGMYAPTLAAVNDRDFGYLGLFMLGAAVGMASFVSVLRWLLEHKRAATLSVMTGLMLGSLRALWPWQDDDGGVLAPDSAAPGVIGLFFLAAAVVVGVLVLEARTGRQSAVQA